MKVHKWRVIQTSKLSIWIKTYATTLLTF